MKKFLLSLVLVASSMVVSAQSKTYYALHKVGEENVPAYSKYEIDRDNNKFKFDSDSEDDANMVIKNYKKSGNKETFDLYPAVSPNEKMYSVEIIDNGDTQQFKLFYKGQETTNQVLGTQDQWKELYGKKKDQKVDGKTGASTEDPKYKKESKDKKESKENKEPKDKKETLKDKAKDKTSKTTNKVKKIFKKN